MPDIPYSASAAPDGVSLPLTVFARQKDKMKLFIRTIGIGRAEVKIGMANIAYNMLRYVFHEGRRATA